MKEVIILGEIEKVNEKMVGAAFHVAGLCARIWSKYNWYSCDCKLFKTSLRCRQSELGYAQDKNGIIYFANNDGLLTFDGNFWRRYSLPDKTKVRSIAIDKDRIYVGGQSELGYFSANEKGALYYTSLMPRIEEKGKDFTDVWNICLYQRHVFFRA
jgi:hypothetical protein